MWCTVILNVRKGGKRHFKRVLKHTALRQVSVITVLATDLVREAQERHNLAPTVSEGVPCFI